MDLCTAAAAADDGNRRAKNSSSSEEKSNDDSIGFGDDLWFEILPKLPLKSLVRFKCVSKSWLQMASNIIIQSITKNPISGFFIVEGESLHYLAVEETCDGDGDSGDDDEKKKRMGCTNQSSLSILPSHPDTEILDCRGGFLLCSSNKMQKDYFLCNPITCRCISFTPPPIRISGRRCRVDVIAALVIDDGAYDYSSYSLKYRVIRISIGVGIVNNAYCRRTTAGLDICIDIYSSENGKWVMSKDLNISRNRFRPYSAFFDGGIYLLAKDSIDGSIVLRFDLHYKSFELVWRPPGSVRNWSDCLGVCEGHLCYAQCIRDERHCMEVWEFGDEKEWILKNGIEVEEFAEGKFDILAFHPYMNAVFVRMQDRIYWCDFGTRKFERIMSC